MPAPATRVLVFGEALYDELPAGRRPGGGALNTAAHLAALGSHAALVTAVGGDDFGDDLIEVADGLAVATDLVQRSTLPTGRVGVAIGADGEPSYEIHAPVAWDDIRYPGTGPTPFPRPAADAGEAALPIAASRAAAVTAHLLSARGPTSAAALRRVLAKAPPRAPRFADLGLRADFYAAHTLDWLLRAATVAKCNAAELRVVTDVLGIESSARSLAMAYGLEAVVVTQGAAGAYSYRDGQTIRTVAAPVETLVDTVGCGDAFLAGYVHAYLSGLDEAACLRTGCARGGYAATLHGGLP